MAKKKVSIERGGASEKPTAREKTFAWLVNDEVGLPRGQVRSLLEAHGVDQDLIKKIVSDAVPYGHEPTN